MIRQLTHRDRRLYLTLLVNFSLMGGVVTLFGAALTKVIQSYGWNYADAGTVYAASSVGFFTSSLVTGFLIDRFGSKPVLVIGLVAEAVSLMFFARTPSVPLNVALYFIIGLGLGSNEAITNSAVVRIEERGKSRLMNLMHAFWCVGAVLGPLGVARLIQDRLSWQIVFPLFGGLIIVMTGLLSLQRFPRPVAPAGRRGPEGVEAARVAPSRRVPTVDDAAMRDRDAEAPSEPAGVAAGSSGAPTDIGTPRKPAPDENGRGRRIGLAGSGTGAFVLLCALSIFVYIGVEKGVYNWVAEYFVKVLGSADSVGAVMVALYWVGQFAGRLTISLLYRGSRLERVLLALAALTVLSLLLLVLVRVTWVAVLCTIVAGLANSGIFPLIISLTGKYSARGRSVGLVTSAGGVAGFIFPIVVAAISDRAGIARGFESVFLVSLILLAVCIVVVVRVGRLDRAGLENGSAEVGVA